MDEEYEESSLLLSTTEELFGDLLDLLIERKERTGSMRCD
jgi:hypothetical protein